MPVERVNGLAAAGLIGLMVLGSLMLWLAVPVAWLLNDLFFDDSVWAGFLIESLFWLLVAGGAGLFAYRQFQAGVPPTPELAIEEAKRVKETFEAEPEGTLGSAQAPIGGNGR